MQLRLWKQLKTATSLSLCMKFGALVLLFSLCVLIVACGGTTVQGTLGDPSVTVTIQFNGNNGSPTPPLAEYSCGAWATQTSPPANTGKMVNVYAKFVHNIGGNPVGVDGASATATVHWADGSIDTQTVQTLSDGVAVFSIPPKVSAVHTITLVDVTFIKDAQTCTVPQAAYFTLIIASPTAASTSTATPGATGTPSGTPIVTPSPTTLPFPSPTVKPRRTPPPKP